jgi:acetyl-CoA carboxylase biotin carboxyl carrier protein
MADMSNSQLTEVNIELSDGTKISMKKETVCKTMAVTEEVMPQVVTAQPVIEEKKGNIITSPMVGTFYLKPSPTSAPFVEVGKEVKVGDTLCIIEAMKLMNEIESEHAGKVVEVLAKDGDVVEYGTPLFRIM